jgi:hypothetical protein
VIGTLAFDPLGAAGLSGTPTRRLDRTPLVVSARRLSAAIVNVVAAVKPAPEAASPPASAPATLPDGSQALTSHAMGGSATDDSASTNAGFAGQVL